MKKFITFLVFFMFFKVFSQEGTLSGTIIDATTKEPISYVTITCKDTSNKVITGIITDKKGKFLISKLPLAKLHVSFKFIGYETINKTITLSEEEPKLAFGVLFLKESDTKLDEVEVNAETTTTVTQKIDRKIINIGNDLSASGTNALQMLQNIPTLDVDPAAGIVSMRGDSNVTVLIDGKPSNLDNAQLLRQIRSNNVKQVELITNPSAKYSPEGMSGLINLVLKKNTQIGFNGSVTLGVERGKHTRPDFLIEANYKTGNINFYGDYNFYFGDYATVFSYDRKDIDFFQNLDFLSKTPNNHTFRFGADIDLGKSDVLSFYRTQRFSDVNFTTETFILENNMLASSTAYFSEYNYRDQAYNIDYLHKFNDKGEELEVELNYSIYGEPEKANNTDFLDTNSILNFDSDISHTRKILLANLDYTKPIKEGKLELGLEFRNQNIDNKIATNQQVMVNSTTTQAVGNTDLTYERSIFSGYANFSKTLGKFSFQAGLRAEQLNLEANFNNTTQGNSEIKDDIFSLYPSAFLTYNVTDNDSFQLNYSRRVNRPSVYHVYSIFEFYSPLVSSIGNPNLLQQFTNSIEFNYTKNFNKGYLILGTFYRRSSDVIGILIETDPLNPQSQIRTFTNYDFADNYGIDVSASYKLSNWWTIRPSVETYVQKSQGFINNRFEEITNSNTKGRLGNSFKINKKLSLQFDAVHNGRRVSVQQTVEPFTYFNASARLSLFNDNGSLTIRGTDIFDAYNYDLIANNPFNQNINYDLEVDVIYIGFSYNFGSGKNKARDRKHRESNEKQKGLL
ncbi:outer membrane beta-barrel family protein [Tenacibaculum sp. M341]|uniref:outer membrane beta-barrel family protein n=1 Tax=Tenacibaculum sp. M341 TaxID=2530339 RepID=UPI00104E2C93|nr:outer membrane beta-barrel family protein [Tenacibaculum sp. M341]TCI84729.1 TonB-dependent receptor [Tenacibaculum sp. M341]